MNLYNLLEDYFVDSEDAVRKVITWFLNQVMEFEALQQSGAEKYERNDSRKTQRNVYRKQSLTTRNETYVLSLPCSILLEKSVRRVLKQAPWKEAA